eukprot:2833966-Rhodomonas_salina.2
MPFPQTERRESLAEIRKRGHTVPLPLNALSGLSQRSRHTFRPKSPLPAHLPAYANAIAAPAPCYPLRQSFSLRPPQPDQSPHPPAPAAAAAAAPHRAPPRPPRGPCARACTTGR